MNNRGQLWALYIFLFFIIVLVLFALIPAWTSTLDGARGEASGLNCPGTPDHNATSYTDQSPSTKLIKRPVCFVTGMSMVYFTGAMLIASAVWMWKKIIGE